MRIIYTGIFVVVVHHPPCLCFLVGAFLLVKRRETVDGLVGLRGEEGIHLMEDNGVDHLKDMIGKIDGAKVLKDHVLNQRVIIGDESIGVRSDDLIVFRTNKPVFDTRNGLSTGVQVGQERRSLQELKAREADGINDVLTKCIEDKNREMLMNGTLSQILTEEKGD